jgi:hypothetical protein
VHLPITCSRPGAWCQSEPRAGESITYTLSWSAENSGEARGWWGLAGLQTTLATFVIHPPPKLSRIPPAPFAPRERALSLSLSHCLDLYHRCTDRESETVAALVKAVHFAPMLLLGLSFCVCHLSPFREHHNLWARELLVSARESACGIRQAAFVFVRLFLSHYGNANLNTSSFWLALQEGLLPFRVLERR